MLYGLESIGGVRIMNFVLVSIALSMAHHAFSQLCREVIDCLMDWQILLNKK